MQLPEVVSLRTDSGVSLQKSMLESLIGCTIVWGLKLSIVKWGADPILALRNLFGPAGWAPATARRGEPLMREGDKMGWLEGN